MKVARVLRTILVTSSVFQPAFAGHCTPGSCPSGQTCVCMHARDSCQEEDQQCQSCSGRDVTYFGCAALRDPSLASGCAADCYAEQTLTSCSNSAQCNGATLRQTNDESSSGEAGTNGAYPSSSDLTPPQPACPPRAAPPSRALARPRPHPSPSHPAPLRVLLLCHWILCTLPGQSAMGERMQYCRRLRMGPADRRGRVQEGLPLKPATHFPT